MTKQIICNYCVCLDGVAGWLGSYQSKRLTGDVARGLFAGEIGTARLLALLDQYAIPSTWFIPGHSLTTFPAEVARVVGAGHEIGVHGYSHEAPARMTQPQEEAVLAKCVELIEAHTGRRPTGYNTPGVTMSSATVTLLLEYGFTYDHSLMHQDFSPYYVRTGDAWTHVDYHKTPHEWMRPLRRGELTRLIEIPSSWYLEDWPPFVVEPTRPGANGFMDPRELEQSWRDQFDWVYRELDYAVFSMSIHPDIAGHPHILTMQARLIDYINRHTGVLWLTLDEIARDFARRVPPPQLSGEPRIPRRS